MNKKQKQLLMIGSGGTSTEVVNNDLNAALKEFKRKVKNSEKLRDFKNKREFKKPSIQRRETLQKAIYQNQLEQQNG